MRATACEVLEQRKTASPFDPHHALSFEDYPRTIGTTGGAAVGGLAGLGHGAATGASGLGYLARTGLGMGLGALVGHELGDITGHTSQADETENLKYDREGPARALVGATRPFIPTLAADATAEPGHLAVPATHQDVNLTDYQKNVTEPVSPGPLAALGGRVSPQQVSVSAMSPHVSGDHFLRPQYINNQPVQVPSLDALSKDEHGYTLLGSETPGSRVGYDYNDALSGMFSHRLPVLPGENAVLVGSHAHGDPLGLVSGVTMADELRSLKEHGVINKGTDSLGLLSCNAAGCNVPGEVQKGLGFVPPKLMYTPPGGVGTDTVETNMLNLLHENPEYAHRRWIQPSTVTMADVNSPVEPAASRYHTEPLVPTAASSWVDRHSAPIGAAVRGAAHVMTPFGGLADRYVPTAFDALHRNLVPAHDTYNLNSTYMPLAEMRAKLPQLFTGR